MTDDRLAFEQAVRDAQPEGTTIVTQRHKVHGYYLASGMDTYRKVWDAAIAQTHMKEARQAITITAEQWHVGGQITDSQLLVLQTIAEMLKT